MTTSPSMASEPVLAFEGIHNFRDYGGYSGADGKRLRKGLLFRSGQHLDASPADLERLQTLGLAAVIDLRSDRERQTSPCPRPIGFNARIIATAEGSAGAAPHVAAARRAVDPAGAREAMLASYSGMPFRPLLLDVIRRYFEVLEEIDGPSLIHCMAGKDRTGLAVALFHEAMGVSRPDIYADYLLTNVAGNVDARVAAGAASVRSAFGTIDNESLRVIMSVDADYLATAQAAIVERHGSIPAYLREAVGVSDERIAALRAKYLA